MLLSFFSENFVSTKWRIYKGIFGSSRLLHEKTKITSLRTQIGREINKVRKKKSGQAATDNYESNWVFWEKLQFLIPVMQAGKSRDNLRRDLQTTLSHTSVIPEENNYQLGELDKDLSILPDLQNDGDKPILY